MNHKDKTAKNLFTTVVVILSIFLGVYLVLHTTSFFSNASPNFTPQEVTVSNITDNSFTVSWVSAEAAAGYLVYGQKDASQSAQTDDRDNGSNEARFTHHVSLKNLTPSTSYQFKINSGGMLFDDSGKPYQQVTAQTLEATPPLPEPIVGKITFANGSIPKEALVYWASTGSNLLSSTINKNGNFLITLTNARNDKLSDYMKLSDGNSFEVFIQTGNWGKTLKNFNFKDRSNLLNITLDTPPPPSHKSDVDLVKENFGKKGANLPGDLNHDGVVNALDLAIAVKKML